MTAHCAHDTRLDVVVGDRWSNPNASFENAPTKDVGMAPSLVRGPQPSLATTGSDLVISDGKCKSRRLANRPQGSVAFGDADAGERSRRGPAGRARGWIPRPIGRYNLGVCACSQTCCKRGTSDLPVSSANSRVHFHMAETATLFLPVEYYVVSEQMQVLILELATLFDFTTNEGHTTL